MTQVAGTWSTGLPFYPAAQLPSRQRWKPSLDRGRLYRSSAGNTEQLDGVLHPGDVRNPNPDPDGHAHSDTYSYADSNANGHSYGDAYGYADGNPNGNPDTYA